MLLIAMEEAKSCLIFVKGNLFISMQQVLLPYLVADFTSFHVVLAVLDNPILDIYEHSQ